MSAALVGQMISQHTFMDDLESSIYILLWVVLVYSEISDFLQGRTFLVQTLDPQPCGPTFSKADFLKGRTFLSNVTFPGRPALHELVNQMAQLFAVRYEEKPTNVDRKDDKALEELAESNPSLRSVYENNKVRQYDQRMSNLESKGHDTVINLFDNALRNRSQWPDNDFPVKQPLVTKPPSFHLTIKTGWSSTLCMENLTLNSDSDKITSQKHEHVTGVKQKSPSQVK